MLKYIKRIIILTVIALLLLPAIGFGQGFSYFSRGLTTKKEPLAEPIIAQETTGKETVVQQPIVQETEVEKVNDHENKTQEEEGQAPDSESKTETGKVAYLTFDDGPSSKVTPQILEILKQYDLKATFFVIGKNAEKYPQVLKQVQAEGHLICNHTYSHDYKKIYSGPKGFLNDLQKGNQVLQGLLGESYQSKIIRFPGGSFEKKKQAIRQAVKKQGYEYIDWNALNGDSEGHNVPASKLIRRIKETTTNKDKAVILMHDTNAKQTTVDALPAIIEYLQAEGYVFKTLEDYDFSVK